MSYQLMRNLKKQGPSLAHCDSVVFEAMNNYWAERGGQWHFFRKSVVEQDSAVLKRIKSIKNTFPYMN